MGDTKPTTKRVTGEAYWRMRGLVKKLDEATKAIQAWREAECERRSLYPDQVNWAVGAIYDTAAEIRDGQVVNAKVVGRLPLEVLAAQRALIATVRALDEELVEYRDNLARRLRVWPEQIFFKDGSISEGPEYEAVNVDAAPLPAQVAVLP